MYSTDLEETQWQVIKKILNVQERKRKYDLREIWNAIFYVVKTGCQWRMLPSDFAPWECQMLESMFIGNPVGNTDRLLDFSTAITGTLFFAPSYDFLGEE